MVSNAFLRSRKSTPQYIFLSIFTRISSRKSERHVPVESLKGRAHVAQLSYNRENWGDLANLH